MSKSEDWFYPFRVICNNGIRSLRINFHPSSRSQQCFPTMNSLSGLPLSLWVPLLQSWLLITDIGRLDSAACSLVWRDRVLQCLNFRKLKLEGRMATADIRTRGVLSWAVSRRVHLRSATIEGCARISIEVLAAFFAHNSSILEKTHL
jgi:hypothetical protein